MRKEVAIGLGLAAFAMKAALGASNPIDTPSAAPTSSASSAPQGALEPAHAEAALHACLNTLQREQQAQVERSIRFEYRLPWHDAQDVARDAMIRVCIGHAEAPYRNLGAVYLTAARNQARRGATHRRRFPICPIEDALPACSRSAEDDLRLEQEARLVEAALCKEDMVTQRIVRLRLSDGTAFDELGREHGLDGDQTRTRYHNGLRRVQRRVAQACGAG